MVYKCKVSGAVQLISFRSLPLFEPSSPQPARQSYIILLAMGSQLLPLQNNGIYHNLPTFPSSLSSLTAIVTGSNGISGFATLRVLLDAPSRWEKIYTLSRKPTPDSMLALLTPAQRSRIQHVAIDFLDDPSSIASALKKANVTADYVFFYSYLQPPPPPGSNVWSNADELVKVNSTLFGNFLSALPLAQIKPKRLLLQTGAKNYGVHLGRARTPCQETDPLPSHLEPNFYYPQYDLLEKYAAEQKVGYNIICPAWIIGSTTAAQINALHPFAVYAAVQAHLGLPLKFPSDWDIWQSECKHSTARLTGYLSEWAVLEDSCANQKYNAQDTSALSWDRFYEALAEWYGVKAGVQGPEDDEGKYMTITGKSGKETPMGKGPPTTHRVSFGFVQWAQAPENREAWKAITAASKGSITSDPFEDPVENFSMADAALMRIPSLSMRKARLGGWTGYVDSLEGVKEMYWENAKLGLLPGIVG